VRTLLASNARWNQQLKRMLHSEWERARSDALLQPPVATAARIAAAENKMDNLSAAWRASLDEVQQGTARGPFSFAAIEKEYGYGCFRLNRRFAVITIRDSGELKIRACDHVTESLLNPAAVRAEAPVMPPADIIGCVGRVFARAEPGPRPGQHRPSLAQPFEFGAAADDKPHAYREAPDRNHRYMLVALVNPETGVVYIFVTHGSLFGAKLSGSNFLRIPTLICAAVRSLLAALTVFYMDDLLSGDPRYALGAPRLGAPQGFAFPGSSQGALWAFCAMAGSPLSADKCVPWSISPTAWGLTTDFSRIHSHDIIVLNVKPSTRAKVRSIAAEALDSNTLTPSSAGSLFGKVWFATCISQVGKAALQPISARQYARDMICAATEDADEDLSRKFQLSPPLRAALERVTALMDSALTDVHIRCCARPPPPIIILSDAQWAPAPPLLAGAGRVAFIVICPRDRSRSLRNCDTFFADTSVPDQVMKLLHSLRESKVHICALEEIGIAAPYFCPELQERLRDADVIHLADNQGANCAAIKGFSASPALARIVSALHIQLASLRARWWLEYVRSEVNLADDPSRGRFSWLLSQGATRVSFRIPNIRGWTGQ